MWLYMIMIAMRSGQRAAVIDPGYTDMWQYDQDIVRLPTHLQAQHRPTIDNHQQGRHLAMQLDIREHTAGVVDDPELIAIPIFIRPNHWTLGIYTRDDHTIRYYDTLWTPLSATIREQLTAVVRDFFTDAPQPAVIEVPTAEYNRQTDGFNCGPHCLLIWESFLTHRDSTLITPLNMRIERNRLLSNLTRRLNVCEHACGVYSCL
jgi:hypothetical protein